MKLSGHDKAWHAAFKPHFTSTGKLVYKANGGRVSNEDGWTTEMLVEEFRGMRDLVVTSLQGGKVDNVSSYPTCFSNAGYFKLALLTQDKGRHGLEKPLNRDTSYRRR